MTTGLILMTALVPTKGHEYIINFACNFVEKVYVIVSGRSFEPVPLDLRVESLRTIGATILSHMDDNAPQNPQGDDDVLFWDYWKNIIEERIKEPIDYVFASEVYGAKVASLINADFIPVDISRDVVSIKSSTVRKNLFNLHYQIAEPFKQDIKLNVVLFGAESCGKTTMAKQLAKYYKGQFLTEWARLYLETVGSEITEFKLKNIVLGQAAQEGAVLESNALITFKDTDLLTTLGFYDLYGISKPVFLKGYLELFRNDLYIVMNDEIPFEPDPLRYGVIKRETNTQYWIDLLCRYNRKFYVVTSTNFADQLAEIREVINNFPLDEGMTYNTIREFNRE